MDGATLIVAEREPAGARDQGSVLSADISEGCDEDGAEFYLAGVEYFGMRRTISMTVGANDPVEALAALSYLIASVAAEANRLEGVDWMDGQ